VALSPSELLTPALLRRLRERAPALDRSNTFCAEDLAELAEAGYLTAALPTELGGQDWGITELVQAQRLVAAHAPATALAVNMHLVWTGVDRLLRARGDERLARARQWVSDGEILAFGVSEPGNSSVLFDSLTTATGRAEGGYTLTGTKIFTSLAPAWTRLGVFGKAGEGEDARLVHGFVERQPGVSTLGDWDAPGMRASGSFTTQLDGAVLLPEDVHSVLPVGPNADPLIFGIFASFLTLLSAVYVGIADRAVQLAAGNLLLRRDRSTGTPLAAEGDLRRRVAEAGMVQLSLDGLLRSVAADLDAGVDHAESWFPRLVTLRTRATDGASECVQQALRVSGGGEYRSGTELSRLARDVAAGLHHPSDDVSAHRTVATWLLGPVPETD